MRVPKDVLKLGGRLGRKLAIRLETDFEGEANTYVWSRMISDINAEHAEREALLRGVARPAAHQTRRSDG